MSEEKIVGMVGSGPTAQNVSKPVVTKPPLGTGPAVVPGPKVSGFDTHVAICLCGGQMPKRATDEAAAFDVHANVNMNIPFKGMAKVPLGFKTIIQPGYYFQLQDRSGMALKGITVRAGVIDSDYRDEWCAILANETNSDYYVSIGERVAQAVLLKLPTVEVKEVNSVDFDKISTTNRGGGFGSTGK